MIFSTTLLALKGVFSLIPDVICTGGIGTAVDRLIKEQTWRAIDESIYAEVSRD